ncbi:hypothetical protein ACSSS7_002933 [Eimeria intestinalis]
MRGKALVALPLAVLSLQARVIHAGEESPSGPLAPLPHLSPTELKGIADRLNSLASSDLLGAAGLFGGGEGEGDVDQAFVLKALRALGTLLSSKEAASTLVAMQDDPERALKELIGSEGGEDDEALEAVLTYFFSLRKVLGENDYLRSKVNEMIRQKADILLQSGNFAGILADIAQHEVFNDLKDEVEEDLVKKGGPFPAPDLGDEMSR